MRSGSAALNAAGRAESETACSMTFPMLGGDAGREQAETIRMAVRVRKAMRRMRGLHKIDPGACVDDRLPLETVFRPAALRGLRKQQARF
jgi:hypothetical protein